MAGEKMGKTGFPLVILVFWNELELPGDGTLLQQGSPTLTSLASIAGYFSF
jgi:hypothetical protein